MKTFTPAQKSAIESTSENILVLAGPGSGKTATTVERIKRLVDAGVDPRRMVAITFTNAGARELEHRIIGTVEHGPDCKTVEFLKLGYCGTLHGFALRMLKQHGAALGYGDRIALIDEEASADLIQSKATSLGCKTKLDKLLKLKSAPGAGSPSLGHRSLDEIVIAGYYDDMREAGLVDFDLLLSELRRMLGKPGFVLQFDYLFVDEVQDSAEIDWNIYAVLPIANKFFVGDPDQAIYSFRGGRVDLLQEYARRPYVTVIKLEANFRSKMEICLAANTLIYHNAGRIDKLTKSVSGVGGVVVVAPQALNEGEEIALVQKAIVVHCEVDFTEIAILARNNDLCRAFREALKASGIPVVEPPKSDLPKDWALARSLVELLAQPDNETLAFFYLIMSGIKNGFEEKQSRECAHKDRLAAQRNGRSINDQFLHLPWIKRLEEIHAVLGQQEITRETRSKIVDICSSLPADAGLIELALAMNKPEPEKEKGQGVTVTTYHGAKGREFDTVFLVGTEDEVIPGNRKTDTPADVEEARRLFYVGVTRARKALFISCAKQRKTSWGSIVFHAPSRFIKEISN